MNSINRAETFLTAATVARLHKAAAAVAQTCDRQMASPRFDSPIVISQLWNFSALQRLQDTFAEATRSASIIIDTDGNLVTSPSNFSEVCRMVQQTERGRECCDISDRERSEKAMQTDAPVYHMCRSCGFLDGSVPILFRGQRIGYWLVGQCNALGVSREDIAVHARTIGADVIQMLDAYDRTLPMSVEQYEQILELLDSIVKELTSATNRLMN